MNGGMSSGQPLSKAAEAVIKRSLLVGNFEAAVQCCMSTGNMADAMLLARFVWVVLHGICDSFPFRFRYHFACLESWHDAVDVAHHGWGRSRSLGVQARRDETSWGVAWQRMCWYGNYTIPHYGMVRLS